MSVTTGQNYGCWNVLIQSSTEFSRPEFQADMHRIRLLSRHLSFPLNQSDLDVSNFIYFLIKEKYLGKHMLSTIYINGFYLSDFLKCTHSFEKF